MLNDKVALVTGGSSGIGQAIAMRYAAAGAKVAVVASADVAKAQVTVDMIRAAGGIAEAFAADVRDREAVSDLIGNVITLLGPVDILVTAAGIFLPTPIGEADIDVFDLMVDTNLKAAFLCINAVVPGMKQRGGGRIICLSSVAATLGVGGFSAYCATKAAVSQMVRALAIELAPYEININAIAPGNTETPMNDAMRTDPAQAKMLRGLQAATPSVRTFSTPQDIAELAFFLASPSARAMHGSTVLIDEGLSAGM
ncbi:SDR family NAD(P)-dependent oxidoreductase [Glacieibacterium sp.]|uniref:SDR family NAD(P)-dependent oxidoreductase n=1 Tax=Glacieibacterium sp. TaxID=2860237 RepID=UPI003B00638F